MGSDIEPDAGGLDTLLFGEPEAEKSAMAPYGCAIHGDIIYVCDIQQSVVLMLDIHGREFGYLRAEGRGQLRKPINLDFADDGRMYVADGGRRQVVVFNDSKYEAEYGPFADKSKLVDVAVLGDELYVVDVGDRCVRVINRFDGTEQRVFGNTGNPGELLRAPTNIALDSQGRAYVVDTLDQRVFVFDVDGTFLHHIGSPGRVIGQFARPKGIAIYEDLLFVIDHAFENCQIFDLEGEPLMFFGGPGVGAGNLYSPAGVWVGRPGLDLFDANLEDEFDAESIIIITNLFGPYKVNCYAFGKSNKFSYPEDEAPDADALQQEP